MASINFFRKISLLPQGVRYKLLVAFSLMSVIPLLVITYLVNSFVFLEEGSSIGQASVMILFCVIIAWLGLFLAKSMVERVVDMALEARFIAEGNYDRKISSDVDDEVGQIGEAVNALTRKIKNSMSDLKDYQEKMKEINLDVQKKVLILSGILQICELTSSSVNLDSTLELILAKLSQNDDGGFAALYFPQDDGNKFTLRLAYNLENENLLKAKVEEGAGLLGKSIKKKKHVVVDSSSRLASDDHDEFCKKYKCKNAVLFPIFTAGNPQALLLVGNNTKNFTYTNEDVEVLKIFAEQASIAIENNILMQKAGKKEETKS